MENREIKFRAFQDNQMLYSPISSNYGLTRFFGLLYEDAKIMQYSGLKDKNGKEIYEGDILQADYNSATVVIEFRGGQFVGINTDKDSSIVETQNRNWLSWFMIGNIYENPELLIQLNKAEE